MFNGVTQKNLRFLIFAIVPIDFDFEEIKMCRKVFKESG